MGICYLKFWSFRQLLYLALGFLTLATFARIFQRVCSFLSVAEPQRWTMHFLLPKKYILSNLVFLVLARRRRWGRCFVPADNSPFNQPGHSEKVLLVGLILLSPADELFNFFNRIVGSGFVASLRIHPYEIQFQLTNTDSHYCNEEICLKHFFTWRSNINDVLKLFGLHSLTMILTRSIFHLEDTVVGNVNTYRNFTGAVYVNYKWKRLKD